MSKFFKASPQLTVTYIGIFQRGNLKIELSLLNKWIKLQSEPPKTDGSNELILHPSSIKRTWKLQQH